MNTLRKLRCLIIGHRWDDEAMWSGRILYCPRCGYEDHDRLTIKECEPWTIPVGSSRLRWKLKRLWHRLASCCIVCRSRDDDSKS